MTAFTEAVIGTRYRSRGAFLAACAVGLPLLAAAGAGWATTRRGPVLFAVAAGICVLAVWSLGHVARRRDVVAEALLWAALLAPLVVTQARTSTGIARSPLTPLAIVQGVGPACLLVLALSLTQVRLAPLRRREVLLSLYLGVALCSSVWSIDPLASFLKAAQLATVWLVVLVLTRMRSEERVLASVAAFVHVLAASAMAAVLLVPSRALAPTDVYDPVLRLHGVFPSIAPDILGFIGAVGFVAALAGVGPGWSRLPLARLFLLALDLGALLLSRSRTGFVLAAVGVVVLALRDRSRGFRYMATAVIASAVFVVAAPQISQRAVTYFYRGQSQQTFSTLTGRFNIWSVALRQWRSDPLLGQGYYAGHRLGEVADQFTFQTSNLDNTWVESLLDVGVLGTIPLALFVLSGLRVIRRGRRRDASDFALAVILMGIAASFVNPSVELVGYTMVVVGLVLLRRDGRPTTRRPRAQALHPVAVSLGRSGVERRGLPMWLASSHGLSPGITRPTRRAARSAGNVVPRTFGSSAVRTAWTLADQAVSSLTNFGVTVVVARAVSPHDFGVFAFAYTLTFFALQFSRAFTSEPVMIRHSASPEATWRRAVADAAGVAVYIGLVCAALIASGAVFVSGQIRLSLLAVAVTLPGLLVQDFWRFAFFAQGRPQRAFVNDVLWAVLQTAAIIAVLGHAGASTPAAFLLAWGVPASVAALCGVGQSRTRPSVGGVARWLRLNSDISPRYAVEFVVYRGAVQAALYVVGIVGGLTALGGLRAAQALFGPLNVAFLGLGQAGIPEAVRAHRDGKRSLGMMIRLVSLSLGALAALWLVALLVMPVGVGRAVLGDSWATVQPLLVPTGVFMIASGIAMGPWVGIRALAAAPESLRARLEIATATLALATTGALVNGATGAAVGLAVSSSFGVAVWWRQLRRALGRT